MKYRCPRCNGTMYEWETENYEGVQCKDCGYNEQSHKQYQEE